MTTTDVLGVLEVALYRRALGHPGASLEELAKLMNRPLEELDAPMARLLEMGLFRTENGQELVAVSPMLAEATVLGAEDLELAARRAALEARRDTIRRLVPEWNSSLSTLAEYAAVDVISDQSQIGNILMHYADQCREELLSVAPGRPPKSRIDSRTRTANLYSLRRGIHTRALYQQWAVHDRHTQAYLEELADNGAQIRIARSVPSRSLVIDREVALLPIPTENPRIHHLAVVREENVVAWVVTSFEQLWGEAAPLEDVLSAHAHDSAIDPTRSAILRLLADGEKDEAISRRLSISVRTCRRHIAEYMIQVGASSRFQAGVIASRAGHTDGTTAG